MKRLVLSLVCCAGLGFTATAEAVPYLGFGEASRALGKRLHRDYTDGVTTGTMDATCERYRRNKVACDFSFLDGYGDLVCGYGQVTETRQYYITRIPWTDYCD